MTDCSHGVVLGSQCFECDAERCESDIAAAVAEAVAAERARIAAGLRAEADGWDVQHHGHTGKWIAKVLRLKAIGIETGAV